MVIAFIDINDIQLILLSYLIIKMQSLWWSYIWQGHAIFDLSYQGISCMYYVFNCSCVVARSVCLNSTCVKNLESPFYMNLEIKIYQIKHMCYYFLFHLRSILLFYQKVTSMLVISLTKIFHTFVCPDYAVSHVCFFST